MFQMSKTTGCKFSNYQICWSHVGPTYRHHRRPHYKDVTCASWQHDCLFNSLFRLTPMKTSKCRITGLVWRKSTGDLMILSHKGPINWKEFPCHDVIMKNDQVLTLLSRGQFAIRSSARQSLLRLILSVGSAILIPTNLCCHDAWQI